MNIYAAFTKALGDGLRVIGQVSISPGWTLCHVEDVQRGDLRGFTGPEAAREIAKYDDLGAYRPLKTAPNLRHGWQLHLATEKDVLAAFDFLYPAAVGMWLAASTGNAKSVALRETLDRQTGMYRVARNISDPQAEAAISGLCATGCLRHRLWGLHDAAAASDQVSQPERLPLLCLEACNLLVASCREIVKNS